MTNKERCAKRRNKSTLDPEKHVKTKADDAERKRKARATTTPSGDNSNEVRRLKKALQEAIADGDRREKEARDCANIFMVSHQDASREG